MTVRQLVVIHSRYNNINSIRKEANLIINSTHTQAQCGLGYTVTVNSHRNSRFMFGDFQGMNSVYLFYHLYVKGLSKVAPRFYFLEILCEK